MEFRSSIIKRWNTLLDRLKVKTPVKKVKLSNEQIKEVCDEIEHQWLHLLITRAVFTNKHFPDHKRYVSPNFYSERGVQFSIEILTPNTPNFKLGAFKLNNWHNKNYVIRLYGILEKYKILHSGRKAYKNELMELIYYLRPEIGAHGSGRKPMDSEGKRRLKKATLLINKLFPKDDGTEYEVSTVKDYWLPIDGVLEKLKVQVVDFVKSLKQKE